MRRKLFGLMTMLALVSMIAGCQQIKEGFSEATQAIDEELEQDRKLREQRMAEKKAAEEKAAADKGATEPADGAPGGSTDAPKDAPADGGDSSEMSRLGSPVTVTVDGMEEKGDSTGNFWDVQGAVSDAPTVSFEIAESMGEFQMCILNIYTGKDPDSLEEKGAYAVTDLSSDDKTLAPGVKFNLAAPPSSVTILSPAGARVEKIPFQSGKTYLVYFVVNGSKESTTHITRFTVK